MNPACPCRFLGFRVYDCKLEPLAEHLLSHHHALHVPVQSAVQRFAAAALTASDAGPRRVFDLALRRVISRGVLRGYLHGSHTRGVH